MPNDLTMEEVADNLRKGKGSIKLATKGLDGKEKEIAVWGGYELDGYDRTLNVFINADDLNYFVINLSSIFEEARGCEDPCADEVGWQMTVDLLDMATTSILRGGEGKIVVETYIRDHQKSYRDITKNDSGELLLDDDGAINVQSNDFDKKPYLTLLLGLMSLRKYLLIHGVVKELYDLFDESAAVLVKQVGSGNIKTTILRGRNRPDLPCHMFLIGDQMCRPYIDEMLNLPTGGKVRNKKVKPKVETEEEKRQKLEKRAEEYGVSVDDLDKHEKYIEAKGLLEKAVKKEDYEKAKKVLLSISEYRDAAQLIGECEKKIDDYNRASEIEPEYIAVNKAINQAKKDVVEIEERLREAKSQKDVLLSTINNEKRESRRKGDDIEAIYRKNMRELMDQEDQLLDNYFVIKRELRKCENELSNTFFLFTGKKKRLRTQIESLRKSLTENEKLQRDTEKKQSELSNNAQQEKKALSDKISDLKKRYNELLKEIGELNNSLPEFKNKLTQSESNLDILRTKYGNESIAIVESIIAHREEVERAKKEEERRKAEEEKRLAIEKRKREEEERQAEEKEIENFILERLIQIGRPFQYDEIANDFALNNYISSSGKRITNKMKYINNLISKGEMGKIVEKGKTFYYTERLY